MVEWMRLTIPRELDPPQGVDRLVQFDRIGKGCLGYLLVSGGEALIVDPPLHFDTYLAVLEGSGAELVGVADTHVHADYVSGAPSLSRRFGVPYYLHPADAVYPYDGTPGRVEFEPLAEEESIQVGRTKLRVMHTPGHTEGSVTFLIEDRVALTGDFFFVESIGRPDLGGKEEEWSKELWDSMARAIRSWDDGVAVYPAHYQTQAERRMGRVVGVPFGTLLRENPLLRIQDPEVFLHHILAQKAPFPDGYRKIKAINLGLAPVVESEVEELEIGRNECALGES
jgi:glyoxylase-like metal-dependent hydrolase (beta-lactamase superfamily II)